MAPVRSGLAGHCLSGKSGSWWTVHQGKGESMARTPLAGAVQDAVAAARRGRGAAHDAHALRQGGGSRRARPDCARPLRRARTGAGAPKIVVVGAGLAGLTAPTRLRKAGYIAEVHEASDRIGGRCWTLRGAFADGQIAEHGGELIDQGHTQIRHLAQELGLKLDNLLQAEQNGTELLGYFDGSPYTYEEMTDDIKAAWQKIHDDVSAASYPTTFELSTERGRELDKMSIVDWIDETFQGGIDSRIGQLLDVAYNIEYGAECAEQSSLNLLYLLGYRGQGQFRVFGDVEREVPRRRRQRPDHRRGSRRGWPARSRPARSSSRSAGTRPARFTLTFAQASGTKTVTADKVVLALPFSILRSSVDISKAGFEPLKLIAIREQGMGTNSKLHVQFSSRFWRAPGLERRDVLRHRLPEHLGGHARPARQERDPRRLHRRQDRRELRLRHARVAGGQQFLGQIEPVLPGRDAGVERPGDDRLLARLPLDEGLVLLLEGRPVPALRRHRGQAPGQLPLRRRAHVDRLPGLPERRGRDGAARGRGDPRRPQVAPTSSPVGPCNRLLLSSCRPRSGSP